jgi:glutamyl-tRNA reductase
MQRIVVLGLSHKTAPVELRERFAFTKEELELCLPVLASMPYVSECLVLATCNRVEVYAVSEDAERCVETIKTFLSERRSIPVSEFSPYLYISVGHMAVRHLYNVASGLDSMVVGEPQILGQIKDAYRIAYGKGTAGLILNRLCHSSFFVAKRIRTETGVGSRAVSVSYVAVELAKRIFDDLTKRSVMLIGAGEMAELAAKNLIGAGVGELVISSRSYASASLSPRTSTGSRSGTKKYSTA